MTKKFKLTETIGIAKALGHDGDRDEYTIIIRTYDRNLDAIMKSIRSMIDAQNWDHWDDKTNPS